MNFGELLLIGRVDQVGDSFKTFVDRKIRERRRDERRQLSRCFARLQALADRDVRLRIESGSK